MKILHLMPDEKFIDGFIAKFERVFPGVAEYYICNRSSFNECVYVKDREHVNGFAPINSENCRRLLLLLNNGGYDAVFVHTLASDGGWRFIADVVSSGALSFLMFWGKDVYGLVGKRLMKMRSFLQYVKNDGCCHSFFSVLNLVKFRIQANGLLPHPIFRKVLRANYICPVIKTDYDMCKKKFGKWMKAEYCPLNYASGSVPVPDDAPFPAKNGNVVVNNSEDWGGNHFDVMHWLWRLGFNGKVITPISYGHKLNQTAIAEYGRRLFGEKYVPITDFLPLNQYREFIESPSYMVMGHLRQQAMGNINMALKAGTKLFFYKRSPAYIHLRRRGYTVFAIEDVSSIEDFLKPLSADAMVANRKLSCFFGKAYYISQLEHVMSLIETRKNKQNP